MPTITVKKIDGTDAASLELSEKVFNAPQNRVLVREAANAFLSNQRQGTHATKTRALVSGGGKKPWKQKGTGRARQGSIRAPQWRGGAIIFGPQPRDYREKVNRKKRQAALRAVLSARAADGALLVVESLDLGAKPSTKAVVQLVESLGANGRVLFITEDVKPTFLLSARNLPYVEVTPVDELNVYSLLVADTVVLTRAAVAVIEERAQ
ncbi:MAG: 50S ribosomal protein L4 [Candidatus Sumerlaeia bacterium]|nr:50S ribosomal protein L4 [Candidatus Sumerlaeia bacterium]